MKKILALLLVLILAFSCFACNMPNTGNEGENNGENTGNNGENTGNNGENTGNNNNDSVKVMTYAEYIAAPMDSEVVIEDSYRSFSEEMALFARSIQWYTWRCCVAINIKKSVSNRNNRTFC